MFRSSPSLQFRSNDVHNSFEVLQDVVIPEAQNAVSCGVELRATGGIVGFLFSML